MNLITAEFEFCAAHRLWKHPGRCANIHGHNYRAEVTATTDDPTAPLDELGMVADFSLSKEKIGEWIDGAWDHGFLYNVQDPVGDSSP